MQTVFDILRLLAVLAAAVLLGNWFIAEVRQARKLRKPWYAPYLSTPGLLILILCVLLPLLAWVMD